MRTSLPLVPPALALLSPSWRCGKAAGTGFQILGRASAAYYFTAVTVIDSEVSRSA